MSLQIDHFSLGAIVHLNEELSLRNIHQLEIEWDRLLKESPRVMAFDCSELEYLDSSAIGTLVKFLHSSVHGGVDFVLIDLKEPILNIFRTAKIVDVFHIVSFDEFNSQFLNLK